MDHFFEVVITGFIIAIYMIPVILALVLAIFGANLFSALFQPVTTPIHKWLAKRLPQSLYESRKSAPLFQIFGAPKNILFIGFVTVFLIVHYLLLGKVDNLADNISLLFPGSALDQVISHGTYNGTLNIRSFFVEPSRYLQTYLYSAVTGLFVHIGCTADPGRGKIHFLVKLLYALLISWFSSIVLGMLPPDLLRVSLPKFSFAFSPMDIVAGSSDTRMILASLWNWCGKLLSGLARIIPAVVAFYFLAHSVSGFAAAFLGGFLAMSSMALAMPEGYQSLGFSQVFTILLILALGETLALTFHDFVDTAVKRFLSLWKEFFVYYNAVTLLVSYFVYPLLVLSLVCLLSLFFNGFRIGVFLLGLVGLLVFSGVIFLNWKLARRTAPELGEANGTTFAVAMVLNLPIWLIYIFVFAA